MTAVNQSTYLFLPEKNVTQINNTGNVDVVGCVDTRQLLSDSKHTDVQKIMKNLEVDLSSGCRIRIYTSSLSCS